MKQGDNKIRKVEAYILIIKVKQKFKKKIGAKGNMEFERGYYFYVGSGRQNLVQRIKRHLRMEKKRFWHIDHMLSSSHASIRDILIGDLDEEVLVRKFEKCNKVVPFGDGFGASDSKNATHLFYCRTTKAMRMLRGAMDSWS